MDEDLRISCKATNNWLQSEEHVDAACNDYLQLLLADDAAAIETTENIWPKVDDNNMQNFSSNLEQDSMELLLLNERETIDFEIQRKESNNAEGGVETPSLQPPISQEDLRLMVETASETNKSIFASLTAEETNASAAAAALRRAARKPKTRPKHECSTCGKCFVKLRNFNNHLLLHSVADEQHKCPKCGIVYLRSATLERHMKRLHASEVQEESHRCRFCQKFFRSKYALNVHLSFHTGDLPCICDICDKRYADNAHLRQHIRVRHLQFRFKCDRVDCDKTFETDRALRNHGYEHDKSWPFVCQLCGRGLGTKYNCREHLMRTHKVTPTEDELNAMHKLKRKKSKQIHSLQKVPNAKLKFTDE